MAKPSHSGSQWAVYSQYKKRHTLKYEVAICPRSGKPVWMNGPFYAASSDIRNFRSGLLELMEKEGWFGLADGTYQGEYGYLMVPPRPFKNLSPEARANYHALASVRSRVEVYFSRMKVFHCLHKWRHHLSKHPIIFFVILSIVSLDLTFSPMWSNE